MRLVSLPIFVAETMRSFALILAALIACLPVTSHSQESAPKLIDRFTDWMLYSFDSEQGQVCYIASLPTKEDGDYTRRGPAAVLVAKLPLASPGENEQVSVQPGYSYLDKSTVDVTIDDEKFSLFTDAEHAWANTPEDDQKLIAAMRRGAELVVRGTSVKKTYSLDTYSLLGFTAAYTAMKEACAN